MDALDHRTDLSNCRGFNYLNADDINFKLPDVIVKSMDRGDHGEKLNLMSESVKIRRWSHVTTIQI